jgi:hypothetical protein
MMGDLVVSSREPELLLDALARVCQEHTLVAELTVAGPAYADANTYAHACLAPIDAIGCRFPTTARDGKPEPTA